MFQSSRFIGTVAFFLAWCAAVRAQTSSAPATDHSSSVRHALELAKTGHCTEALPMLNRSVSAIADRALRYEAEFAVAQCAMSLHQVDAALQDLARLNRDFPHDPQVLYVTAHYCSQLATSASEELAGRAPTSYQAQELDAESFEAHGKWDDAISEYRRILEQYPQLPGIHYRLGRIILSMPSTPTTADDARREFEAELKIDPNSAASEFMLGDLARQLGQWDEAIKHFSRAANLDVGFLEAYLGLGMALNAEGKYEDAVPPLVRYVKGAPDDAAGHYQLAMAYARTGHRDEAARELERQRELDAKVNKEKSDGSPQTPQ
ncbi:MAG TPA: tetratricopeptide repeat protein [Candidatus Cybelea sp.]|nr:tetratricopeptide repeat protein [Candidatus Cybelea sp.]